MRLVVWMCRSFFCLSVFTSFGCATFSCSKQEEVTQAEDASSPADKLRTPTSSSIRVLTAHCRISDNYWYDRVKDRMISPIFTARMVDNCTEERELLMFSVYQVTLSQKSPFYQDLSIFLGIILSEDPLKDKSFRIINHRFPLPARSVDDDQKNLLNKTDDLSGLYATIKNTGATIQNDHDSTMFTLTSSVSEVSHSVSGNRSINLEFVVVDNTSKQEIVRRRSERIGDIMELTKILQSMVEDLVYIIVAPKVSL